MSAKNKLPNLKALYEKGVNIIDYLKNEHSDNQVTSDDILLSYDLQAGTYTKFAKQNQSYISEYVGAASKIIKQLGEFKTFLEVGVGEATVCLPLSEAISQNKKVKTFGFDISWSRVRYAVNNIGSYSVDANFFCADLFSIPLPDSSIDIVFTSHALEPNGGREVEALRELSRVAKKYIVLLEPDYCRASKTAKSRMEKHNYVKDLAGAAKQLGLKICTDEPFSISQNELNPTGLLVIEVDSRLDNKPEFICPVSKAPLKKFETVYTNSSCGLLYPLIDNIPCLTIDAAIVGTRFGDFNK